MSPYFTELILSAAAGIRSYRAASEKIKEFTNETISHEAVRNTVLKVGKIMENKEDEEIKRYDKKQLVAGTKEIPALFEEADGIWINLQGKDRNEQLEKNKKQKGDKFNPNQKVKTELKLHVTYEGHTKGNIKHEAVNKAYIAGIMKPKRLKQLRDARVYQKYNVNKIELRVLNGDGAKWINATGTEDTIKQKDKFHIYQEIERKIKDKKEKEKIYKMIEEKKYADIPQYIEELKHRTTGEVNEIKKLEALKSYLSTGLERYQEVLEREGKKLPEAPKGIEYRNTGIMESQIFSVLKQRLASGRKSFSREGASLLSKVCAIYYENSNHINIEDINKVIKIDTSEEDYIKEIEKRVKENKKIRRADKKETNEHIGIQNVFTTNEFVKKVAQLTAISDLTPSF